MSTAAPSALRIIEQLNQARSLAFSSPETYPQVLKHVLKFVPHHEKAIEAWCVTFLRQSFVNNLILKHADKVDLALDALGALSALAKVKDLQVFKDVINISCVVYKLVFKYVADNDGCPAVWALLMALKNDLISKFSTTFPLDPADNEEHDIFRNVASKLELMKFLMIVIEYQSKTTVVNPGGSPCPQTFLLSNVAPNHTLINASAMEHDASQLIDIVLAAFRIDIINCPLVSATINHLGVLIKRKPQFASKILATIEVYDTNHKQQSNYQTDELFRLTKKYIDRSLKVLVQHVLRNNLVPANLQASLGKKLTTLIERGNEIRKKNIFIVPDPTIKKKKWEGFHNPSRKIVPTDYKQLYCLNNPADELNNFDLANVPLHILVQMVVAALQKASTDKLTRALDIIGRRYVNAVDAPASVKREAPTADDPDTVKRVKREEPSSMSAVKHESAENDGEENQTPEIGPETVYSLGPPRDLSMLEKKQHLQIIIRNFFKLATSEKTGARTVTNEAGQQQSGEKDNVASELTLIAIQAWKKDSWVVLLTRLATRGMRQTSRDGEANTPEEDELSDMVRSALFDYFMDNIHTRIDVIIDWLNEEWYSEKVFREARLLKDEYTESIVKSEVDDSSNVKSEHENKETEEQEEAKPSPSDTTNTPTYNKWAGKVLDAIIPFLEPTDRKIFIRLLSDLPSLNRDLVARIKSLCFDPARAKIGFLSLQFLIMYRPPVKEACIDILRELAESDQEDLREEASKLVTKYTQ